MQVLVRVTFYKIIGVMLNSAVVLAFCAWIVQSSRYISLINKHHIALSKFMQLISYLAVDIFALILPIALAIAVGFVGYQFCVNRESVAMQSAGVSPNYMLRPVIGVSVLVIAYLYCSYAYLSPWAWSNFRKLEFNLVNNIHPPESAGPVFANGDFAIYAQKYVENSGFRNIFIVDNREPAKVSTFFARRGVLHGSAFVLHDGERIEIDRVSKRDNVATFRTYRCDLHDFFQVSRKKEQPNEKFLHELLTDSEDISLRVLLHQKMTSPFIALIFALAAFIATLTVPYTRKPTHKYILILTAYVILFQGIYFWLFNAAAKDASFIVAGYLFTIVCLIAEIIYLLRMVMR